MGKSIINQYSKKELEQIILESFSMKEVVKKLGYKTTHGNNYKTVWARINQYKISTDHFTFYTKSKRLDDEDIFIKNSKASQSTLRRKYLKGGYTEYKCSICGLEPIWNGKELVLTLDHKNGDNTDNELTNLRWICPNCDRQLPTFGARNLKREETSHHRVAEIYYCQDCGIEISRKSEYCHKCIGKHLRKVKERPDKNTLFTMLNNNNGNFTMIGNKYDVTDNTVRKWCTEFGLPTHSYEYKAPKETKEKQKMFRHKVAQINKETDEVIAEFDSIKQAESQTGIYHITEACDENNTKRLTAGGYKWKLVEKTPCN